MNITENNLSYESRKIFNKVFEKDISSKKKEKNICQNNGEEIKDDGNYVTASYKTNKELKKEKYENILINKIKNNVEFFLSNFAVPLDSPLYIKGEKIKEEEENNDMLLLSENVITKNVKDIKNMDIYEHNNNYDDDQNKFCENKYINNTYSKKQVNYLKVNCNILEINNCGKEIFNKYIILQNCSSNIILYKIIFRNKILLNNNNNNNNNKIKLNDVLYYDVNKNFTLFIYPNSGYIKPNGSKQKILLTFIFKYFVNTFGCITIKYYCNNNIFKEYVYIYINSFFTINHTDERNHFEYNMKEEKLKDQDFLYNHLIDTLQSDPMKHMTNIKKENFYIYRKKKENIYESIYDIINNIYRLKIKQICNILNFINSSYNIKLNYINIQTFLGLLNKTNNSTSFIKLNYYIKKMLCQNKMIKLNLHKCKYKRCKYKIYKYKICKRKKKYTNTHKFYYYQYKIHKLKIVPFYKKNTTHCNNIIQFNKYKKRDNHNISFYKRHEHILHLSNNKENKNIESFFNYMKSKFLSSLKIYTNDEHIQFFMFHFFIHEYSDFVKKGNVNQYILSKKKKYIIRNYDHCQKQKKKDIYISNYNIITDYKYINNLYEKIYNTFNQKKEYSFHIFLYIIRTYINELISYYKTMNSFPHMYKNKNNITIVENAEEIEKKKKIQINDMEKHILHNNKLNKNNKDEKDEKKFEFIHFLNYTSNQVCVDIYNPCLKYLKEKKNFFFFINFMYLQHKLCISPMFYFFYYIELIRYVYCLFVWRVRKMSNINNDNGIYNGNNINNDNGIYKHK
ncbi:hypothetical protein PFTANZ_02959 [Plasmodium falciparum Tanzania (2000708)]|uniref:Uncharacterized protein n=1 Tax=Plasmodium falciparum Tanzania (2000708) TaxID=1036725 RepID=A0A024W6M8_PLAFA|nr:hypothetical protein PFTANZ_02959 [Plasmodium falciparum Tanzania (2000708)]